MSCESDTVFDATFGRDRDASAKECFGNRFLDLLDPTTVAFSFRVGISASRLMLASYLS